MTAKLKKETGPQVVDLQFDEADVAEAEAIRGMNLYQRINAIRGEVPNLSKDLEIDGKYRAVSHDQVTDVIRPLLVKYGVLSIPSLKETSAHETNVKYSSGRQLIQYRSTWTVRFVNVDKWAENFEIVVEGHADEAGDKAPGKMASYAVKYAYTKMFAMAAGEAEESRLLDEALEDMTLDDAPKLRERLLAYAVELFGDEDKAQEMLSALAQRRCRIESGDWGQIKVSMYERCVKSLRERADK
jgi:hypothetical protein